MTIIVLMIDISYFSIPLGANEEIAQKISNLVKF